MINFLSGIVIGLAFIIPGVSGGTLMVMMNLYDRAVNSIVNYTKDIKKNTIFLGTIGLGVATGILLFSKILHYLLNNYECPTKLVFIGLIVGGIPATYKTIKSKKGTKLNYKITLLTLLISIGLFFFEKYLFDFSLEGDLIKGSIPLFGIIIAGFLYASGKIIPGISGTALLMLIGMYNYLINILADINHFQVSYLKVLIPFFISFIISALILFKMINYFLEKHYSKTYSAILGFILGSIIYVLPSFYVNISELLLSIILGLLVMLLTYKLSIKKSVK